MEVHSHAHTPRKKWTHYFWEFFMLFLAVTAGFFVENQREHMIEHKREIKFMRSYVNDLSKDIYQLDSLINKREERRIRIDSLNFILRSSDPGFYGSQLYYFARYLPRPFIYIPNDATLQQLRNSGNLRLIQKQEVADTILNYDLQFKFIETIMVREDQLIMRIFDLLNQLFDPAVFDQMNLQDIEFTRPAGNPQLLTNDKKIIQQFLSELQYLRTVNLGAQGWFKKRKELAKHMQSFIKDEYHFK
jgi:hypothetical protein